MNAFETPAPITADVDIVSGDIRFTAADRADTVVEVEPIDPTRALDVEAAEQVRVEYADGRLRVWHPKLRTVFTKKFGSVRVHVALPTGSDVRGDTAQGDCLVHGAVGSCRLATAIGDIRIGRADRARLKAVSGKVTVGHVSGPAEVTGYGAIRIGRFDGEAAVKNLGGDITVDAALAKLDANTVNGAIRIGAVGVGPVDLYAAVGQIDVGVPEGAAVALDARASTGRVRDGLAVGEGPEVRVRARCNGGDITLRRVARV
jgi:DUF4097 and DUF4098 domain-containing protein YvlB